MDDLIKILQKLMSESPTPKGGIADTAEGIEFIGRKLTKDEIGSNAIIGSKLTDASRFKPFSVQNVGIENRYSLLREYGDDLAKKFEETIKFIKDNPDVRFTQMQKDNILYNLGVYRRVVAEKDKIAKGLTEQGKNVDDIFNKRVDNLPEEMLTMNQVLEKFQSNVMKMKEKLDELKGPSKKELDEKELRLKRLYDGPGYDRPGSSLYRGYGSFFLPKLHEKGIIKLDDQIYNNLKEGQHHWGGADYYAPDPVRIWRKHFGNEVFEKLDNFNPDNEDIFQWLERNNIQPIQKDGPKNALEYLTPTEITQQLADETSAFGKYKNPESAGDDAQFYYRDKPEQRMERITYHGENIGALEQALQALDPDSYKEYFRTKPRYDSKVLPFKELNAEGGRVGFGDGSGYIPGGYTDDAYEYLREIDEEIFQSFVKYKQGGGKMKYGPYAYNAKRMMFGAFGVGKLRKAEGGRVGFRGGGKDASQPDFDPGPGEVSSDAGFANTEKSMATQEIKEAPQVFDIGTVGDPSQNPFSQNVGDGIDYTPSFDQPTFFETALNKGKDFFTTAYNNPLVRLGLGVFLPTEFQRLQQILALKNLYGRITDDDILEEELKKQTGITLYSDGGRVNLQAGSYEPFYEQDLDINPNQTVQVPSRIKSEFDDKTDEAYRIGSFTSALDYGPENYENLQAFASLPVEEQEQGIRTMRFMDMGSQQQRGAIDPFGKQGYSSDIRHGLGTSAGKDAIVDFISSNTRIPANSRLADDLGIMGANIASLFEEGKDIFSSAKDYAERYPGLTGIQDYDFMPNNKYLTQPLEDIAANYVGSKIPFGMSTPQKIAFISNYAKYGNQTLDQIKNLELRKVQDRIRAAEQEKLRRQKIANTPGAMTSGGGREVSTDAGAVAGAQQDISNYQSFNEVPLKKGGIVGLYI